MALQVVGEPVAEPVAVRGQAGHRGDDEEGEEDVEQRRTRHHEREPVEGEQQTGQPAQQGRTGDAADQADGDQDQQGAEDQGREPPAEGVHPEQLLAGSDQPLADLRVNDEAPAVLHHVGRAAGHAGVGVAGPVAFVAELEQRVGVLGVVGLVEDQLVGIAQIHQAHHEGDGGDREGDQPAGEPVGRHRHAQPLEGGPRLVRDGWASPHRARGVGWLRVSRVRQRRLRLDDLATHPDILGVLRRLRAAPRTAHPFRKPPRTAAVLMGPPRSPALRDGTPALLDGTYVYVGS